MSNGVYQELERELAGLAGDVRFIEFAGTARLGKGGDGDPVVVAPADRQYPTFPLFWCYREGNATNEPFQAVPWYPGLTYDNSSRHMEVWLVRFPQLNPKLHFIFGLTEIGLSAWGGATPAQVGIQQAAAVTPDKILTNSIYFSSGVTIGFRGGTMRFGNNWYQLPAVTSFAILTTYIPGTANQERWISISINSSGVAGIIAGETFANSETNKKNFLPNTIPSGGFIHLGSVLVANGLTIGTDDLILPFKDIFLAPADSGNTTVELTSLIDVSGATQTANFVLAAGDGATGGDYRGRALLDADIPNVLTISGGTINNTPIGGTTPAAGTFTTLQANTSTTLIAGSATTTPLNIKLAASQTAGALQVLDSSDALLSALDANGNFLLNITNRFYRARRGSDNAIIDVLGFQSGVNTLQVRGGYGAGAPTTASILFEDSNGTDLGAFLGNGSFVVGANTGSARQHVIEPTVGNAVQILQSTATNDDPSEIVYQNRATTTDATVTTLHTFTVPASTTYKIVAEVTARRTGGSAGAAEDGAGYTIRGTYKNVAGTATLIGAVQADYTAEDQAAWDATLDVTGATVRVRVTGALNNNVTWWLTARVYQGGA